MKSRSYLAFETNILVKLTVGSFTFVNRKYALYNIRGVILGLTGRQPLTNGRVPYDLLESLLTTFQVDSESRLDDVFAKFLSSIWY